LQAEAARVKRSCHMQRNVWNAQVKKKLRRRNLLNDDFRLCVGVIAS
jgi:hypothetical protein